jgi:hypothetical protein
VLSVVRIRRSGYMCPIEVVGVMKIAARFTLRKDTAATLHVARLEARERMLKLAACGSGASGLLQVPELAYNSWLTRSSPELAAGSTGQSESRSRPTISCCYELLLTS